MHQNNWVDSEFGAVGSKRLHKYISEVNGIFLFQDSIVASENPYS